MPIKEIIVSDTETTGVDYQNDSLLEVAHVHVDVPSRSLISGEWTYIEYRGDIPPEAKAVHHITEADVRPGADRCVPREVHVNAMMELADRLDAEGGVAWAFHNAEFDTGFLPEVSRHPVICTYRCAMQIWPDAPRHSNQVLRYWLGLEPRADFLDGLQAHRALYDSAVTAALLVKMLETYSPTELVEMTRRPILLDTVRFGKYKGQKWEDVPRDYLNWMRRSGNWANDRDVMYTLDTIQGFDTSKYHAS